MGQTWGVISSPNRAGASGTHFLPFPTGSQHPSTGTKARPFHSNKGTVWGVLLHGGLLQSEAKGSPVLTCSRGLALGHMPLGVDTQADEAADMAPKEDCTKLLSETQCLVLCPPSRDLAGVWPAYIILRITQTPDPGGKGQSLLEVYIQACDTARSRGS